MREGEEGGERGRVRVRAGGKQNEEEERGRTE